MTRSRKRKGRVGYRSCAGVADLFVALLGYSIPSLSSLCFNANCDCFNALDRYYIVWKSLFLCDLFGWCRFVLFSLFKDLLKCVVNDSGILPSIRTVIPFRRGDPVFFFFFFFRRTQSTRDAKWCWRDVRQLLSFSVCLSWGGQLGLAVCFANASICLFYVFRWNKKKRTEAQRRK